LIRVFVLVALSRRRHRPLLHGSATTSSRRQTRFLQALRRHLVSFLHHGTQGCQVEASSGVVFASPILLNEILPPSSSRGIRTVSSLNDSLLCGIHHDEVRSRMEDMPLAVLDVCDKEGTEKLGALEQTCRHVCSVQTLLLRLATDIPVATLHKELFTLEP